ncbi:MAG: ATP-binding protein, partial [Pyrinomonadaceae bacterium]|nr:ATP-binding protein [Pyrinomonadaceae bacterium]
MASESPARTGNAVAAAEAALSRARGKTQEGQVESKDRAASSVRYEQEIAAHGKRINFERRVLLMALLAGVPGTVISVALLWWGDYSAKVLWTLLMLILCWWLGFVFALQRRIVQPLQTLSNLLAALHEGDYSIRARGATRGDALGDVLAEVNDFGALLREQRLGAMEATALLRT